MSRQAPSRAASVLLEVWTTGMNVNQLVVRELEREGVEPEGLALLQVIAYRGPITPTALATEVGLRLTTVSDVVQRLEQARRVRRRANPEDGRSFLVSITRRGQAVLDRAEPAFARAFAAIERELDVPLDTVEDTLAALKAAIKAGLRRTISE